MPPPTDRLYVLARAVLDGLVAHWPVDAEPLPAKQYVSNGQVIWDGIPGQGCASGEQLALQVERTFTVEADIAQELITAQGVGFAMRGATFAVWLIRCVHDMQDQGETIVLPSAFDMEADAMILLADPTAMTNAIVAAYRAGDLGTCGGLAFENWTAQGPEGGLGGGVLRVRLMLA